LYGSCSEYPSALRKLLLRGGRTQSRPARVGARDAELRDQGAPKGKQARWQALSARLTTGTRRPTATGAAVSLMPPRRRGIAAGGLLRLASEADMFVWEKIRLRNLRDDLAAATSRRDLRDGVVHLQEASNADTGALELVDFERDSWPQ
jgi:hypothetical protein